MKPKDDIKITKNHNVFLYKPITSYTSISCLVKYTKLTIKAAAAHTARTVTEKAMLMPSTTWNEPVR
jgi:hypothetical protein